MDEVPSDSARGAVVGGHRVVGVDTGGTFTDVILRQVGPDGQRRIVIYKTLSTPEDPSVAIARGVARAAEAPPARLIHGTTVATNALLERKGARVAFLTTAGFEDLLALRRQNRPELYHFHIRLEPPLVPAAQCFGVEERVGYDAGVLRELSEAEVARALRYLAAGAGDAPFEAVSVCLLHAYANPAHERRLGEAIRREFPQMHVSLSHEILPEFREYERASTTTVNAYVGPVMAHYLRALQNRVEAGRIEILQSSGGRCDIEYGADFPVHTVLSGPAGGVVGARAAAAEAGIDRIITFDMGGTSSDVSLCDGEVSLSAEAEIGTLPVHVPAIDIHTVGAGGGSIAWVDPGGALRVGPRSAGADPGPACYGLGATEPTVTDAHVHLGRVRPDRFLGGEMALDAGASARAVDRLASKLGLGADETARGILDVADANMMRAIKVISLEHGHDPRDFCLVAFGGAGGLHACRLAESMEISTVLIPKNPGILSAQGMLNAEAQRLYSRSFLRPLAVFLDAGDPEAIDLMRRELAQLAGRARRDLLGASSDGAERPEAGQKVELEWSLDLRYQAQSFELNIPVDWSADSPRFSDPSDDFSRRHDEVYGYRADERPIELVTLRLRAFIPNEPARRDESAAGTSAGVDPGVEKAAREGKPDARGEIQVGFREQTCPAALLKRDALAEGAVLDGPAVITEYSGTTVVEPGWQVEVVRGHLLLRRRP